MNSDSRCVNACRSSVFLFSLIAALFGILLTGCGAPLDMVPSRIAIDAQGTEAGNCGLQGEKLARPLRVVVFGRSPHPKWNSPAEEEMGGAEVVFSIENPQSGAVFSDNGQTTYTAQADPGGVAKADLTLGSRVGDVNIVASIQTPKGPKSVRFRAATGVELIGKDLEGPTGGVLEPIGVRLQDAPGVPAVGVGVYFHVVGETSGAKMGSAMVLTDPDGRAVTSWKLGDKSQRNFAEVEIQDLRPDVVPDNRFAMQGLQFEAMALNKKEMLINLLGGLAVFIFGMKIMSNSLQRMADRRLRVILQAATTNRFVATGVGALITSAIQSSSATTVMVVGFVNAGLITLTQAIGVIYGANIGTTMTAQLIAFHLETLSYPAIAIGLVMTGLARKPNWKLGGEAILGFGLLFLGMMTMTSVLKPIRYSPEFRSLFTIFDCSPVGGMMPVGAVVMSIIIGTATTCIIQSSSASVGLVQALASQGLISFYTAVPLVLGDNIGTTITALLASLGANRNAKRAAIAHSLFNVIGTGVMFGLFFLPWWNGQPLFLGLIDYLTPGNAFGEVPENLSRHVANAHSVFNIMNCVFFLPLVAPLARLCQKLLPITDADRETVLQYLEPRLLRVPSLALQQAVKEVAYMVQRAQKSINEACEFFFGGPADLEEKVSRREKLIDRLQHEITGYLVELSRMELPPSEGVLVPALIHAVNDAERIGDHSENLLELTRLRREKNLTFSERALSDIVQFQGLLQEQFDATYKSLVNADTQQVEIVLQKEQEITAFMKQATDDHVKRLEQGQCEVQAGVIFLDYLAHLERVGDHLTNIAERAGQLVPVLAE